MTIKTVQQSLDKILELSERWSIETRYRGFFERSNRKVLGNMPIIV
ncbi:hypothetical protein OH492_15485 [Vibrio chagasii]|nr:hypothetical protein [Vibrio chagasii]